VEAELEPRESQMTQSSKEFRLSARYYGGSKLGTTREYDSGRGQQGIV
jgi:hypothetical protein